MSESITIPNVAIFDKDFPLNEKGIDSVAAFEVSPPASLPTKATSESNSSSTIPHQANNVDIKTEAESLSLNTPLVVDDQNIYEGISKSSQDEDTNHISQAIGAIKDTYIEDVGFRSSVDTQLIIQSAQADPTEIKAVILKPKTISELKFNEPIFSKPKPEISETDHSVISLPAAQIDELTHLSETYIGSSVFNEGKTTSSEGQPIFAVNPRADAKFISKFELEDRVVDEFRKLRVSYIDHSTLFSNEA